MSTAAENRTLFGNIFSLISGRIFISLSRLLIALIILRLTSVEMFGAYIVVLTIIFIGEGLMDFGFTDIAVNKISQDRECRGSIILSVGAIKTAQAVLAYAVVVAGIVLLGFTELIPAALVGGIALIFYGAALVLRINFRLDLAMYRDIGAESAGVVLNIALVTILCLRGTSVAELIACHTLSRLAYLLLGLYFSRRQYRLQPAKIDRGNTMALLRQAVPLGIAGLLVAFNDNLAPLLISKLIGIEAVAIYAVAIRFIIPATVMIQAIAGVFFTPLSSHWHHARESFAATQQNVVDISTSVACIMFCIVFSGAEFLIGLFGASVVESVSVLRNLSWLILAKAFTVSMFPPVIICGGQRLVMWALFLMLAISVTLMLLLAPLYGVMAVVVVTLLVEILLLAIPMYFVSQYLAGYRLQKLPTIKLLSSSIAAVTITSFFPVDGALIGAIVSLAMFLIMASLSGALSREKIDSFIRSFKDPDISNNSG